MIKAIWVLRAFFYGFFIFRSVGFLSYLGRPIYVAGGGNITFGSRVRIFPGARIESLGGGKIIFNNNVSIGQGLHLVASRQVNIGKDCLFAENIFISDTEHSFDVSEIPYQSQRHKVKEVYIGDNCFLGYGAVILSGTKLGKNCVVGAYSVVKGEYPENVMIVGSPGRVIKKYNSTAKQWERVNEK